jgi:ribosomal protein S27E
MVVFQDRDVCVDMSIVGGSSSMQVRGVIYVPCGKVIAEGNGGTVETDQIIAYRFQMKGDIGSLTVNYDDAFLPDATYAGLVE